MSVPAERPSRTDTLLRARRFIQAAGQVPRTEDLSAKEYEPLTQDVIARALGSLGLAGINQWLREDRRIDFASPVRQDGPGWRAEVNLPAASPPRR